MSADHAPSLQAPALLTPFETVATPQEAVDRLIALHEAAMTAQRSALEAYFAKGTAPTEEERGRFRYPELRVTYRAGGPLPTTQRAYGKFQGPGVYNTTITQPAAYKNYLLEQLGYLVRDYDVTIEVGVSRQEIRYPYVFERGD